MSTYLLIPGVATILVGMEKLCEDSSCTLRIEKPDHPDGYWGFDLPEVPMTTSLGQLEELMDQQEPGFLSYEAKNGELYFGLVYINHIWQGEQSMAYLIGDGDLQGYETEQEA